MFEYIHVERLYLLVLFFNGYTYIIIALYILHNILDTNEENCPQVISIGGAPLYYVIINSNPLPLLFSKTAVIAMY